MQTATKQKINEKFGRDREKNFSRSRQQFSEAYLLDIYLLFCRRKQKINEKFSRDREKNFPRLCQQIGGTELLGCKAKKLSHKNSI